MPKSRTSTPIRLLLSAMVLLPSGGALEVRHAHAHGDKPHQHGGVVSGVPHDRTAQHRRSSHSHDLAHSGNRIESCVSHVHVSFLGFQFTVMCRPDSAPDHGQRNDSPTQALLTNNQTPTISPTLPTASTPVAEMGGCPMSFCDRPRRFSPPRHLRPLLCVILHAMSAQAHCSVSGSPSASRLFARATAPKFVSLRTSVSSARCP
jgi:hypothetical protein